ncbi:unnamed protein product [Cladocopium goreaui]|uniref:AB hydrolase-1 domain-containing protein n=1 Tax=Cladocopium goreaui TaxID=2562237 RepID=A0A9P1DVT0_9DINO|nr:unnamed protein product [Cladocopium goreaui]
MGNLLRLITGNKASPATAATATSVRVPFLDFAPDFVEAIVNGEKKATTRCPGPKDTDHTSDLEAVISQGWALAKCQHRGFAVLAIESSETRIVRDIDDTLARVEGLETGTELQRILRGFYPGLADDDSGKGDSQKKHMAAAEALAIRKNSTPVLVCFYSGGMKPAQGQAHLKDLLAAAKDAGLETLVLDHPTEEPYQKCKDWQSYIEALQQQVETPELRSRPLILFAHSHGCLQAYGLAKQLGKRVLKFFLAARRPPTMPLLDEVWGVSKGADIQSMDDTALLEGLVGAWRNALLESVRGSSLPPVAKKILSTVREQYASPCSPGGSSELDVVVSGDAAVAAPIVAFACSQEKEKGETATKMEGWRSLTSSSFELKVVEADHMDCLSSADGKNSELVDLLAEDMKKLLSDASAVA